MTSGLNAIASRVMAVVVVDRIARWTRLALEFALSQGLVLAAGMLSGLIYVRLMPVEEYALYALCLGMMTLASIGSDLGLTGSLSYFWRERAKSGASIEDKIAAVRMLRGLLLAVMLVIIAVLILTTASRQSVPLPVALSAIAIAVATVWAQMRIAIDLHVMRLEGNLRASYYCEAAGSLARLAAALALLAAGVGAAVFGLLGGLLGAAVMLLWLRACHYPTAAQPAAINERTWSELRAYVLPVVPGVLVYMIQEPLVLWLAATRGGARTISEAFAVGRIGALFAIVGQFIIVVVTPRLAGVRHDAHFVRMATLAAAILAGIGLAMIVLCMVAPQLPLLLIGPRYAHLHVEVAIVTATASISTLTMLLVLCNRLRGWVRLDPPMALAQLAAIVALALSWSFAETRSVLTLSLVLALLSLAVAAATSACGLLRPQLVRSTT